MNVLLVVEGASDQIAVETLAERRGLELEAAGARVVRLGGAHRIAGFLDQLGPPTDRPKLAGLCDAGEEAVFRRALERAGFGSNLGRAALEELGFYVCVEDLEDELIRALGAAAVEEVLRANDDLHRFRTLQQMPAWRGRPIEAQLRRFMGSGGRRKIRYARLLVEALDPDRVPRPLERVLCHAVDVVQGSSPAVELQDYGDDDVWLAEALETDPEVMRELGGPVSRDRLRRIQPRRVADPWYFTIVQRAGGAAIGTIGVWETHHDGHSLFETGWMVLPAHQGRGVASAALALLIERVRAEPRIASIHAFPPVTNAPSNALCRKFGFELRGETEFVYASRTLNCNHWALDVSAT